MMMLAADNRHQERERIISSFHVLKRELIWDIHKQTYAGAS